ncbi:MAG: zinc-ribbon domain-containing protein [Desulfobacterales bacterium]|nr:zinc-ribbon domain-containing protein [Desulfobacterales bacterium]
MDISCDNCQSKFRIPDEKIPSGKAATLSCPKCKKKISLIQGEKNRPDPEKNTYDQIDSDSYDASEKPFDFVEEEGKTVLVCEPDSTIKKKIITVLDLMEYHITEAENMRDALKKMRYHNYDLIVVNEDFDTINPDSNGVLIYLERLHMAIRRNIFVTLMSSRFRTMDNMTAFNKSVNLVINNKDINDFDKILSRGITDNDFFYRVFKESLRKMGQI